MIATSRGTMIGVGVVVVFGSIGFLQLRELTGEVRMKPRGVHPAKIAIERGCWRLDAETGPGESRPDFAADVAASYQTLKREIE